MFRKPPTLVSTLITGANSIHLAIEPRLAVAVSAVWPLPRTIWRRVNRKLARLLLNKR
jgi:hypothetical protein